MQMIQLDKTDQDVERLKYKIASDPKVISELAQLADMLGFGWCGGTQTGIVGEGFDVSKQGDTYVMQAHYDPADEHAGGFWAEKRLKITLSNFKVTIDLPSLKYGKRETKTLAPVAIDSVCAINKSTTPEGDSLTINFTYTQSRTVTNEVSFALTAGITVAITGRASIPQGPGVEQTNTISLSETIGWKSSEQTLTSTTGVKTYNADLPPMTKRLVTLYAASTVDDICYEANASVDFDVQFDGFLRWEYNARTGFPRHRPFISEKFAGLKGILDLYEHREIPNYSNWNWDRIEKTPQYEQTLESVMSWVKDGIGVTLTGKFLDVKGVDVMIEAEEPVPVSSDDPAPSGTSITEHCAPVPAKEKNSPPVQLLSATIKPKTS